MQFGFRPAAQFDCETRPSCLGVGSDDRTVVAACGHSLLRLDLIRDSQDEICSLPDEATALSLHAGRHLVAVATGSATVGIYDLRTGKLVQTMSRDGAPGSLSSAPAYHIAISPDGNMLVTTTTGSRIFVSSIESGQWEHIMFVKYDGCDVTFSPDGKYVALYGAPKASEISGQLTMFLVRHGLQPLWTRWHESETAVTNATFSPDSQSIVTCGAGDGARLWDVRSGDLQWHCNPQGEPNHRHAWSFGIKDRLAMLGKKLMTYRMGHDNPTTDETPFSFEVPLEVSPSGKCFVCINEQDGITAWKLTHSNDEPDDKHVE